MKTKLLHLLLIAVLIVSIGYSALAQTGPSATPPNDNRPNAIFNSVELPNTEFGLGFNESPDGSDRTGEGAQVYLYSSPNSSTANKFNAAVDDSIPWYYDFLVFEKTDGNGADPDGGFLFVNKGIDNVAQIAMRIFGSGSVRFYNKDGEPSVTVYNNGELRVHNADSVSANASHFNYQGSSPHGNYIRGNVFLADTSEEDKVGIGTKEPDAKLHLVGDGNTQLSITANDPDTQTEWPRVVFEHDDGAAGTGEIGLGGVGAWGNYANILMLRTGNNNTPIGFAPGLSPAAIISSIGIGIKGDGNDYLVNSSQAPLHIGDDPDYTAVGANLGTQEDDILINDDAPTIHLHDRDDNTGYFMHVNNGNLYFLWDEDDNGKWDKQSDSSSETPWPLVFRGRDADFNDATLYVSNDKVGIATNTPAGLLDINGQDPQGVDYTDLVLDYDSFNIESGDDGAATEFSYLDFDKSGIAMYSEVDGTTYKFSTDDLPQMIADDGVKSGTLEIDTNAEVDVSDGNGYSGQSSIQFNDRATFGYKTAEAYVRGGSGKSVALYVDDESDSRFKIDSSGALDTPDLEWPIVAVEGEYTTALGQYTFCPEGYVVINCGADVIQEPSLPGYGYVRAVTPSSNDSCYALWGGSYRKGKTTALCLKGSYPDF